MFLLFLVLSCPRGSGRLPLLSAGRMCRCCLWLWLALFGMLDTRVPNSTCPLRKQAGGGGVRERLQDIAQAQEKRRVLFCSVHLRRGSGSANETRVKGIGVFFRQPLYLLPIRSL